MKIRDVRAMLLTAPIPEERQYTSDLGTIQNVSAAIVVVQTDEGLVGYGEAKGTPQVMRGIVERLASNAEAGTRGLASGPTRLLIAVYGPPIASGSAA